MTNKEEQAYLDLLSDILENGFDRDDRTGIGSRAGFMATLKFDLSNSFPLFTVRSTSFKIAFEEMMMFLRGECNTQSLENKGIKIWSGNTSREFLDGRGLAHLPEKHMGKGYSWQIRNFGGTTETNGFDQLKYLIQNIKDRPNDRRHLMNYWHAPQVLSEACLPPCHLLYNCQVAGDKLNALFFMRSSDVAVGLNFNCAAYGFLTHLIAKLTGYKVGTLGYVATDPHIYLHNIDGVKTMLAREPKPFPQFRFRKEFSTLEEALDLAYDDVEIENYSHCGKLKFEMAI